MQATSSAATVAWVLAETGLAGLGRLAALLALVVRPGDVIAMEGDLGAGKTTFARLLVGRLSGGTVEEVPSPTFTLLQSYDTARLRVHHFDLYRLSEPAEVAELGLEEALASGLVLVEWPDRAAGLLPFDRLDVRLGEEASSEELRTVTLAGHGTWAPPARATAHHGGPSSTGRACRGRSRPS